MDDAAEGYNWNNDIIKMISDIEDDIKGRMDQGSKEDIGKKNTTNTEKKEMDDELEHGECKNINGEKMAENENDRGKKTDEEIGEEEESYAEEGYNWNNDIIKMISDIEDDVKRRIDEDIVKTTTGREDLELEHWEGEKKEKEKLEENKYRKDDEKGEEGKAQLADKETDDAEGYNWNNDIIKMISDIEDDIKGRIDKDNNEEQNISEGIGKRTVNKKNENMDDQLEQEGVDDMVGVNKKRTKNKEEDEGAADPDEEEGDVEGYNWNNDIIKMMSDIEDDVKGRIDQNNKEDKEEKTDEEKGETRLKEEEEADDAKRYNWNEDVEDDAERKIAERSKEDYHRLETTPNKENAEKGDALEQREDEDQKEEDTETRNIEEIAMETEGEQEGQDKEGYGEIEGENKAVVEQGMEETVNKKPMEGQVMEKEEGKEKNVEEENRETGKQRIDEQTVAEEKREESVDENKTEDIKVVVQKEVEKEKKVEKDDENEVEEEKECEQSWEEQGGKEEDEDYVEVGDFIKMVSDVEDDVNRVWSEKTKETIDVGVNTIVEDERAVDTAAENQETVEKNSDIEDVLDIHQEKELESKDESSAKDVCGSDPEANDESLTRTGEEQSRAGVDSDCNRVSFSMMDSFASEKKRDDADSCSEEQDSRRLDGDVKMSEEVRLSGEEEKSVGGCFESSVLMSGEDLSRSTECISHRLTSIFL